MTRTRTAKAIKRDLRAARRAAQPDLDTVQRLVGELHRARRQGAAKRTAPTEPAARTMTHSENRDQGEQRKPVMVGRDDVSGWPDELRRKVSAGPWGRRVY